jgi:hypothetical protein
MERVDRENYVCAYGWRDAHGGTDHGDGPTDDRRHGDIIGTEADIPLAEYVDWENIVGAYDGITRTGAAHLTIEAT